MAEQKPIEAMSRLERDIFYGEWRDVSDEQKQFAKDFGEEELLEGIYNHVSEILRFHNSKGTLSLAQVLVCNSKHMREAHFVAGYFKLDLIATTRMPLMEFYICERKNVEILILSREIVGKMNRGERLIINP